MSNDDLNPTLRVGDQEKVGFLKKQISPEKQKILQRQHLGDTILNYIKQTIWLGVGGATLYYSNFFHHLFRNPNINPLFFEISMAAYIILISLILYSSIVLPVFYGIKDPNEFNPKLIPIGAVSGFVGVITLLIAIWPVWGGFSILIFLFLWKGFFAVSTFLPSGHIGTFLFIAINVGIVLSFYIIQHQGYLH